MYIGGEVDLETDRVGDEAGGTYIDASATFTTTGVWFETAALTCACPFVVTPFPFEFEFEFRALIVPFPFTTTDPRWC